MTMTGHNIVMENNLSCPLPGTFPTTEEFQQGLGLSGTVGLYVTSIMVLLFNSALFAVLVRKFIQEVPERQVRPNIWFWFFFFWFLGSPYMLGYILVHSHLILYLPDHLHAQVHRVLTGCVQGVWSHGDWKVIKWWGMIYGIYKHLCQVCGAQPAVVWRGERADKKCWGKPNHEVCIVLYCLKVMITV